MLSLEVRITDFRKSYEQYSQNSTQGSGGLSKGDLVEFSLQRGKIVITPKIVIDRSQFPSADDEYTPAQRRAIDARLAESEEDLRRGRTAGPFNTADEMIASMKEQLKKKAAGKKIK